MTTPAAETLQPAAETAIPSCDVVVLTWDRRDLLEPCVARVLAHTRVRGRLIIVDNGSTDPATLQYLREARGTAALPIEVVRVPQNIGIAAGLNVGLRHSTAPWVCLLNNDLLVTEGWLEEMVRVGERDASIGLINPMSNEFGVRPSADETLDQLGRRCRVTRSGRWLENWQAIGFCVLFHRRVFEEIGCWDERIGSMTDTDYSLLVRRTGRVCAIAEGAYVFHQKSATIRHDPSRHREFRDSWDQLQRKWGLGSFQRVACILPCGAASARAAARVRELANAGHEVDAIGAPADVAGVARHLLIRVRPVPGWAIWPAACWRIVTKKKRFERIIVWSPGAARWLARLNGLHGAAVQLERTGA